MVRGAGDRTIEADVLTGKRRWWPVPGVPLIAFGVAMVFLALNFAAPLMVEPGTVRGLDGGANRVDYDHIWNEMDRLPRTIYWFGDFNCHQKEERSFIINGNQMPICVRDVGMFMGVAGAAFVLTRATPSLQVGRTMLSVLPRRVWDRPGGRIPMIVPALMFWGLFALPLAVDGFYQLGTDYESINPVRLATGFFGGMTLGVVLVAPIISAAAPIPVPPVDCGDFTPPEAPPQGPWGRGGEGTGDGPQDGPEEGPKGDGQLNNRSDI